MHQILNLDTPRILLLRPVCVSLRDLVEAAFSYHNLDYREFVSCNNDFVRSNEPSEKKFDISKLKQYIHWDPLIVGELVITEMCKSNFSL